MHVFTKEAKIRELPQALALEPQVAISHTAGALLSLGALRIGGHEILVTGGVLPEFHQNHPLEFRRFHNQAMKDMP